MCGTTRSHRVRNKYNHVKISIFPTDRITNRPVNRVELINIIRQVKSIKRRPKKI